MDIIFNCPKCEQELAVDSTGSGSEINCPSCSEKIVIPAAPPAPVGVGASTTNDPTKMAASTIHTSAAAKVEMHLKVPVHTNKTIEPLIEKPKATLEVAAKESDKKMRVKTIRHTDCVEVGHDRFDEVVSAFLQKVGEQNITSITPMTYTHIEIGTQKLVTDYAVMVVYRG
jgi:DNA-directed RNA polymerase subunit RPC12/RpoP